MKIDTFLKLCLFLSMAYFGVHIAINGNDVSARTQSYAEGGR